MKDPESGFAQQPVFGSDDRSTTSPGPADVRRAAMDLLARREHTSKELARKLNRKFSAVADLIEEELGKLKAEGLQSDARLAEVFIRARKNRGQGPVKIKMELRGKGVDNETLGIAFDHCDVDWFALIEQVSRRKYGESAPSDARERAKRSRFLQQRGFNFDHIGSLN